MTFFVQNVLGFFTGEIIEPNWGKLEERMVGARTVDQFLRDHTDFLNECRKECMLTDVRFVEVSRRAWGRGSRRERIRADRLLCAHARTAVPSTAHELCKDLLRQP